MSLADVDSVFRGPGSSRSILAAGSAILAERAASDAAHPGGVAPEGPTD